MVHISTDYVFDWRGTRSLSRPDHPTAPLGAYGRTKLMGEQGVRSHGRLRHVDRAHIVGVLGAWQ